LRKGSSSGNSKGIHNLGTVYRELADYRRAKAAFEKALALDEYFYGKEHPVYARI
jgi:tetratricopeptide (TPR) repeat protein